MAVEIKFDANQQYQRDAIDSVVELFAGQDARRPGVVPLGLGRRPADTLEGFQEVVFGNTLALEPATIEANLRRVQDRPIRRGRRRSCRRRFRRGLPPGVRWRSEPTSTSASRWRPAPARPTSTCGRSPSCSGEYGFTKFVIVVPSVAIREGVLSSLRTAQGAHPRPVRRPAVRRLRLRQPATSRGCGSSRHRRTCRSW